MIKINEQLPRGLIVSCQAYEGDPLYGSHLMAAMAKAAEIGGAVGIRANSPEDIRAIRAVTRLPIIGLYKVFSPDTEVYITPDFEAADQISRAGCDIIAIDATPRPRKDGLHLADLINFIHRDLNKPVMADTSCLEDALLAENLGVDLVSTTLAGYTSHGRPLFTGPDLEFVEILVKSIHVPVIAEGRFYLPEDVKAAINLGAYGVAIGEAITRPEKITRRFVEAINDVFGNGSSH